MPGIERPTRTDGPLLPDTAAVDIMRDVGVIPGYCMWSLELLGEVAMSQFATGCCYDYLCDSGEVRYIHSTARGARDVITRA